MVRAQETGIVRCCFILSFSARSYIRLGGIVRGCLVSRGSMPHFVQPDPMPNEDFEIWYIHPGCLSFLHTASLKNKKDSLRRSLLSLPPPPLLIFLLLLWHRVVDAMVQILLSV